MLKIAILLIFCLSLFNCFTNATQCNYVLDTYNPGTYYPIDFCIKTSYSNVNSSYMFQCSSTGDWVYLTQYHTFGCTGTAYYSYNITSNSRYNFNCSSQNCTVAQEVRIYSSSGNCSGYAVDIAKSGYVAGVCYNSSTYSYVYGCTNSAVTVFYYSDINCTTFNYKTTQQGCQQLSSSSSIDYTTDACSIPGYYGIAASLATTTTTTTVTPTKAPTTATTSPTTAPTKKSSSTGIFKYNIIIFGAILLSWLSL